ncbi:MAG: SAM-dependent methyltransferase [bacterium]|nr:SAM-dependent methyltransferase [bacterium]
MKYDQVVVWGRGLAEYEDMFLLDRAPIGPVLAVAEGPSGFNAGLHARGREVVSVDPLYQLQGEAIESKVMEAAPNILKQTHCAADQFDWSRYGDLEGLRQARFEALAVFLSDYRLGRAEGRYLAGALPNLPLKPGRFSLALCSHFLFLYDQLLDLDFHLRSLEEMLRLAPEVRIYPLVNLACQESIHLRPVIEHFRKRGVRVDLVESRYRFQKGADEFLRLNH